MNFDALFSENEKSVQDGVSFMGFPDLSSLSPKRSPCPKFTPVAWSSPFVTLGIFSSLINYSRNFRPGGSVNIFFDCYAKVLWSGTPMPIFTINGPFLGCIVMFPVLAILIN